MPTFAHVSLILAPDRSKLSKRHGATSVGQVDANLRFQCLLFIYKTKRNGDVFMDVPLSPVLWPMGHHHSFCMIALTTSKEKND